MPPEPDGAEQLGLRARKRLATRSAILRAALHVVRERGLDGATVDEISRIADISPRTFFNYFPSKEDAILGDPPSLDGVREVEEFLADRGPILQSLGRVIAAGTAQMIGDPELFAERRTVSKMYPELTVKRMASVHGFELQLTDLARRRLEAEHPEWTPQELTDRARLVSLTAWAFIRHAWLTWLEHPHESRDIAAHVEESFALGVELVAAG